MSGPFQLGSKKDPGHRVRARCSDLGLAVWRTNAAGLILEEPFGEGLLGLWLRAGPLGRRIASTTSQWDGDREPDLHELFTGCWLLPLAERRRRRLVGYTVALAFGPDGLQQPEFEEMCKAAQLQSAAVRRVMRNWANHDKGSCTRLLQMLRWMYEDQRAIAEHEDAIETFTDRLGNAYETIDLLYALGRSMNELDEPETFLQASLERLHEAAEFAWAMLVFPQGAHEGVPTRRDSFSAGRPTMPFAEIEKASRELIAKLDRPDTLTICSDVEGFEPDGGPQIVVQPVLREQGPIGWLLAGEKGGNDPQVSTYDTHLIEAAAGYLGPFLENAELYREQKALFVGMLKALSASIDAKDPYTCGHSARVAHISACLARKIGLDPRTVERIHIAGLVHDIGKIGIPEHILGKTSRLTDDEFDAIKRHPEIGHRILRDLPQFDDVLPAVLHHHERWDGRGYPKGLAGDDIPLAARIMALADTFDAMSSTRAYRPAMSRDKVFAEFRRCSGTQFDPSLVDPFLSLNFARYDEMVSEARDLSTDLKAA